MSALAAECGLECAAPESVGLSSERLERITEWQRGLVDDALLPCSAVLVARRGKVAYWEQCGEQNPGTPLAADTIYRIYSMGKPITSVALLQLYERGKFLLTDPLKLYLPLFDKKNLRVMVDGDPSRTEPCRSNITIAQLLTHTAGLTYDHHMMNGGREWPGKGVSMTEWYEELATRPLAYQPGTAWMYSLATDVCGILIEALSGLTFEDYLRQELFGPLGMPDTGFRVTDAMRPRFATNFVDGREPEVVDRDGLLPYVKPLPEGVPDMSPGMVSPDEPYEDGDHARIFSGGGGMVGTMADYVSRSLPLSSLSLSRSLPPAAPRVDDLNLIDHARCRRLDSACVSPTAASLTASGSSPARPATGCAATIYRAARTWARWRGTPRAPASALASVRTTRHCSAGSEGLALMSGDHI